MNHEDFPIGPTVQFRNAGGEVKLMENLPRPSEEFVALVAREIADANLRCVETLYGEICLDCGDEYVRKRKPMRRDFVGLCYKCILARRNREQYEKRMGMTTTRYRRKCSGCRGHLDNYTKGCLVCSNRHSARRAANRRTLAA